MACRDISTPSRWRFAVTAGLLLLPAACGGGGESDAPAVADVAETVEADWQRTPVDFRDRVGEHFAYVCPPDGTTYTVWGSDVYTDDSSVCTAGVHAGRITLADGGTVVIEMREGQDSYTGSESNGVTTLDYGSWAGSFVIP